MSRPGAAVNIILITDEDRDILADFSHTFGNVLTNLGSKSALLNVVANQARYTRVSSAINHQCLSQVLSHLEHRKDAQGAVPLRLASAQSSVPLVARSSSVRAWTASSKPR